MIYYYTTRKAFDGDSPVRRSSLNLRAKEDVMAYVDTYGANRRWGTLTAVALIHVAAGYALVNGLAGTGAAIIRDHIPTFFIPRDKPLTDPPPQTAHQQVQQRTRGPQPINPSPLDFTTVHNDPVAFTGGSGDGLGALIEDVRLPPLDQSSPALPVRGARPKGNPGLWVTPNDYPTTDLRLEHGGVTRFRLAIGTDGRVSDCTVTGSSGWPALDAAACAKLVNRARFDPALDSTGARAAGRYDGSVRWQVPD